MKIDRRLREDISEAWDNLDTMEAYLYKVASDLEYFEDIDETGDFVDLSDKLNNLKPLIYDVKDELSDILNQ